MKNVIPKDGWQGLKENFSADALSGFLVFLLALPLSLGIAKASEFTPIYGLLTAMIGGIIVSFIAGSPLTIKGPAAGLIVIVAGSVTELGHGNSELGWHLALGAVVVAGVIQVLFGVLKFGKFSDIFPLSAVHGMLAAIGIIIMSKQIHILAGVSPMTPEGKSMVEPLELLALLKTTIPNFFAHKEVAMIGLTSLAIVFGWPMLKVNFLKKIPAPLVVLLVSIPMAMAFGLKNTDDFKPLLTFDKGFFDILGVNVSFDGFHQMGTFIKFVIMFALVGSLEALLTVKAIDMMDPFKRKSNYNKDLIAVGVGNIIAGVFGGLPMISEVARSSANVNNGGRTRWANFFHGIFILLFLIFAVSFSNLIPMTALAAMLIGVGWKLAHPKEFGHMLKIGPDQLVVFLVTIVVTLATDLLIGIAAGIVLKIILHLFRGVSMRSIVKSEFTVDGNLIHVHGSIVFSNFLKLQAAIQSYAGSEEVQIDVTHVTFIDHSSIESLHHLADDFKNQGGLLDVIGLQQFENVHGSTHHLAARKKK
ncbi:MAG: SulP family inorganic anion transporter [Flavobacteriales bacterium]